MRRIALLLAVGVVRFASAQSGGGDATARMVSAAREGTMRYRSIDSAIADGFKRVGVEFPAMGEHWVNLARVLENKFDPARPSVLTYITDGGRRRLAGVAYTALLAEGELPPNSAAPQAYWHEHNGSVAEESLPLHHVAGMATDAGPARPGFRSCTRGCGCRIPLGHSSPTIGRCRSLASGSTRRTAH